MDFDKEFKAFLHGEGPPPPLDQTDGIPQNVEDGLQELADRVSRYHDLLQERGIDEDTISILCMQYQSFILSYNTMRHG